MPKTLIEACAFGRPIITTNAIGCRESVDEGVNGFKVPVKSSIKLAEAIIKFLENQNLIYIMGEESRKKAETEFDVENVINRHLEIYKDLSK